MSDHAPGLWPKGRLSAANPDRPENGRIYEQHEWADLGLSEQARQNLTEGVGVSAVSIRDGFGNSFGMLQRYTQDDALRDAAPDLLEALKQHPEREKPADEMTRDELLRYVTHVTYWQLEQQEPAIAKAGGKA